MCCGGEKGFITSGLKTAIRLLKLYVYSLGKLVGILCRKGGGESQSRSYGIVYPLVGPEFCFIKSDNSMSVGDGDLGIYLFYFNSR